MVQVLEKIDFHKLEAKKSYDLGEIKEVLDSRLFVPNIEIKSKILNELLLYLESKFSDPAYKIKFFVAYGDSEVYGFVISQIDPYYTSYSRKCGTFGWFHADTFEVCKKLIHLSESFIKENRVRKLRGNINFPKNLGGIGFQFKGFHEKMLYGVAYNNPSLKIFEYLDALGYQRESEYSCVHVTQKTWNKGRKIDRDIEFRYATIKEIYDYTDSIRKLAKNSFHEILPDASGSNRVIEFFEAFKKIPKSFYKIKSDIKSNFNSNIPQFVEAWDTYNLEKIEPFAPMAFDRYSGELVGILLGLPDIFETWAGKPITRCNVDTAMVKQGYFGKGIFSTLNNIGQLTCNLFGVNYFEGTGIWSNNSRAIDMIFPHCKPIRKHYVFQRRI